MGLADVDDYHVEISNGLCQSSSRTVTLRLAPQLEVELYAVVTVHGIMDHSYRIEYREDVDPADAWKALAVLKLEKETQLFIDLSSPRILRRFYRAVPVPNL